MTISKANGKLKKLAKEPAALEAFPGLKVAHIGSWGIPAGKSADGFVTCPGAGACLGVCYACQGAYLWSPRKRVEHANLDATFAPSFVGDMVDAINGSTLRILRVHDSGDFYSQAYIETWARIAKACPSVTFYAYTKSYAVGMNFDSLLKLSNFSLIYSEGSKDDSRIPAGSPRARIFSSEEALLAAGYVNGSESDLPAIRGESRIGFVYHGVKKLSPAQIKRFA